METEASSAAQATSSCRRRRSPLQQYWSCVYVRVQSIAERAMRLKQKANKTSCHKQGPQTRSLAPGRLGNTRRRSWSAHIARSPVGSYGPLLEPGISPAIIRLHLGLWTRRPSSSALFHSACKLQVDCSVLAWGEAV